MKDEINTYHVKHEFSPMNIIHPKGGYPIKLNINMTFQTFVYLFTLIGISGLVASYLIELIIK